ncbi:hypothetical protein DXG01_003626 [Tephrocybe rancida]|nr:hypothetical protein DXG01_003626 [Tephrocybe rancida]
MSLKCGADDCTFLAKSARGQTHHRNTCRFWRISQEKTASLRHERAAAAAQSSKKSSKMRNAKKKLPTCEEPDIIMGEPFDEPPDIGMPPPPTYLPPPMPQLTKSGRPRRNYAAPARYRDTLPEPVPITEPEPQPEPEHTPVLRRVRLIVRDRLVTTMNVFGLWRDYPHRPTHVPDALVPLEELASTPLSFKQAPQVSLFAQSPPWPFANMSIYRFMTWLNSGSNAKSSEEANRLVEDVIKAPDFSVEDLSSFNAHRESARMDNAIADSDSSPYLQQFSSASVNIDIPSGKKDVPPTPFSVPGLLYRKITSVIEAAFHDDLAHHLHLSPFRLFHRSQDTGKEERVYGEIFTSDAFLAEHEHVQRHAPVPPEDPTCKREKVIAAIMFSSDGTHLANFGTAKAWPIYLMLGNLSKYFRALPNLGAMYHLAYIPSLPDSFQDVASKVHDKWDTQKKGILTHCRRELMHAVWSFLFDEDFLHACQYGMVIQCADGIERRVYPRLFTYSADYPEKVLLATIRDKGLCPCPRCYVRKSVLDHLGLARDGTVRSKLREFMKDKVDTARHFIYNMGLSITGDRVDMVLKDTSSVPTNNAFVNEKLGCDPPAALPAKMLVVDLLHEFELGVWKTVFKHLIRILYAAAPRGNLVADLDHRYRQTPTFGRDTIRKFATNASEMKKLAARDFEDLLQCSIPAFEDLLPEPHNKRLLKLLYRTAEWHALAKARMHTDSSLDLLEALTTEFGKLLRQFRDLTCTEFATVELPGEAAARVRRKVAAQSKGTTSQANATPVATAISTPASVTTHARAALRRTRDLNLNLYKLHALGDYVTCIRMFGTTDSYSTQLGELSHRLVKMLYGSTNKKDAMKQIAKQVNRREVLRDHTATAQIAEQEALANTPLSVHHAVSKSRRNPHNVYTFISERHEGLLDPAKKNFIPKLQDHLLGRLLGRQFDGDEFDDFTNEDRNHIRIAGNTIFSVQLLRVNYTSYDIRRAYDTINPRTHSFVMSRNPYEDHCMEFLWVRWLGSEPGYRSGRRYTRLPKVGFVPESDPYAFGFLDPACVIRGSHLIPAFAAGSTSDLLAAQRTAARQMGTTEDWLNFYVDIFVDRDMFFRYLGRGIGHLSPAIDLDEGPAEDEDPEEDVSGDYDTAAPESFDVMSILGAHEDELYNEDREEGEEDDSEGEGEGSDGSESEGEDDDDDSNDEDVGYADL